MHRLSAVAGCPDDPGSFVEQPPAPVLLLSSADTDLVALDRLISHEPELLGCELRGLNLASLSHPAVIDHYLASTGRGARLIVIRLLGGRGHWSYGLEAVQRWAQVAPAPAGRRTLLVLAGTEEEDRALASLSSADPELVINLAGCFRQGGTTNLRKALSCFRALVEGREPTPPTPQPLPDPLPWDWRPDPGSRVGLILYRALFQASDLALMEACLKALRDHGLAPRALWVSGLRDQAVQRGVRDLLTREGVELVLCCTAFASVQMAEAGLGSPLWECLGVPVLQVLTSGRSRQSWASSSIGLGPTELGLQIALPELDGRITTRIGAFKESQLSSKRLASALPGYEPDLERLDWIAELAARWIRLRRTPAGQRRVGLVLANYPNRNSRVANGVGLDTPASVAGMLGWLQQEGYTTGEDLPVDGQALIERLLAMRSNDPESGHRPPLDHLGLSDYQQWYTTLPEPGRKRLESVWGAPECDRSLEPTAAGAPGFPIRGLRFGTVALLLQPERGYDQDPSLNYHAPDLPPTHAYLAQYLWLRQSFAADVVVHVGKHGNLEWLPGKGLGLSTSCYPEWALGPLPHLYPFIVNDPGEGSQAKRRSQAVILDHLTPPLGRAELHGELLQLEGLLDEYWEAVQLGGDRTSLLRERLAACMADLNLPIGPDGEGLERRLETADGYLCELKEAQIRLGLHVYGQLPEPALLLELLQSLARPPHGDRPGLTQALASDLGLALDPWSDPDDGLIHSGDLDRLASVAPGCSLRLVGDGVAVLERIASALLRPLINGGDGEISTTAAVSGAATAEALQRIRLELLPRLLACAEAERLALIRGLAGERIAAGPSGAPTRGRPDVLPTGRNFFSVDLRGLPTEAAWDLGRRSAELLLELHLQEQGDHLERIALSVWGTATMRNGGEDIAQALALMGVRPVWDGPTRRLVDLEVITPALLQRPRVDVTLRISGLFRDAFPQLVGWFNRACQLVGALDEPADLNPLAESARLEGQKGRVYGSAPGAYGAGLQGLIDSGQWETREDLGEAFLTWSAWRYDGGSDGSGCTPIEAHADRTGLENRLRGVQVVLHNQDNREHDLLDSDDYYQFHGGLSAAVQSLTGQAPTMWFGDHSRHSRPRLHRLERELDKVLRSRMLNPRWIEAMQRHGYKGGFEMAASLDYLFAYDASTGLVPDWSYGKIVECWLGDPEVRDFLKRCNPWALRDMAERLLEAHHRGLWSGASPQTLDELSAVVLESEAQIETR